MNRAGPWRGITDAPIDGLGVLVVGPGHPGRAAALLPIVAAPGVVARLAFARNRESAPQLLAIIGIERDDVAAHAELAAGAADDHLTVDDQRHQRQILAFLVVLDLLVPHHLPALGVERDDVI